MLWWASALLWACSGSVTDATPGGGAAIGTIVITPGTATVAVGAQVPLQAVASDVDGKVLTPGSILWTVQDTSIATISSTGVVSGRAVGSTQVAASADGKSGVGVITVQQIPVGSVVVRPNHIDAVAGTQTPLSAIVYDGSLNALTGRTVIWSSSDVTIATVDTIGLVSAHAPGSATITATAEGKSDSATVTVSQAPVASVAVTPTPLSMSVGQTTQLTATPLDQFGNALTGRTISWSSSAPSVATVSSIGVLTAVAAGATTVTATSEGQSGTAAVTISNFGVGSVSVQPHTATVLQRASTQLSVTIKDVTGAVVTGRVVAWTTSSAAVATVTPTGLVTGVTPGIATITATSGGIADSAAVTVTIAPVNSVAITPPTSSMTVGQSVTLVATARDINANALPDRIPTWTSATPSVATVSSSGVVTGMAAGSSTITATSEGKTATATVNVAPAPVGDVSLPAAIVVIVGQTVTLDPTVTDANGSVVTNRPVTWTTDSPSIATVSSSGVVTGIAPGQATITAASETKTATTAITVIPPPVAAVALAPAAPSVIVGQTVTIVPTLTDASSHVLIERVVTWTSATPSVATVSSAGVVSGVTPGTSLVTATSEGKTASVTVTVNPTPTASVSISPPSATVFVGATTTLSATTKDAGGNVLPGRAVTWTSSATSVATISATGLVTGVAPGTSTITATNGGAAGTSTVTVTLAPVASVAVAPGAASITVGHTTSLTATLRDANGNVLTGRPVTWSSGTPSVATVSASGVVTAVAAGTSTIMATSGSASGTSTVTVTVVPVATVTVAPDPSNVVAGSTTPLTATLEDADGNSLSGRVVTWTTGSSAIATVSSSGVVTGVSQGTTTITATSEGRTGTSTLTVAALAPPPPPPPPPAPVASVSVTPASVTLSPNQTSTLTATVKDAHGNVLTGNAVTWTSNQASIATVNTAGVVTAKRKGTATITATVAGKTATATITVK